MPDKKRYEPIPKDKRERVGIPTGLYDSQNNEIITGDLVEIISSSTVGRVFWNRYEKAFGLFYGCWYANKDQYSPDSYGKFVRINSDQGMKMNLIILTQNNDRCSG